ncbi:MAG: hypothetical protein GTO41_13815 [Burkholderiales bacterium]|nr:hypothetical protein [Burkholderiales bacterium]
MKHDAETPSTDGDIVADGHLAKLLDFDSTGVVKEVLRNSLLNPVRILRSNQGKRVRGRLVNMAYGLVNGDATTSLMAAKQCRACAEVVELIHAGSLVVDDIEDGIQDPRFDWIRGVFRRSGCWFVGKDTDSPR